MKRILFILIFAFLGISVFSQETISVFKKSSIGVNYTMDFSSGSGISPCQHFGGLSFDYPIYKGLFISIGTDFNRKVYFENAEDVLISGAVSYSYERYSAVSNVIVPVSLKYYFLLNSKTCHPYVKLGMRNNLKFYNGYMKTDEDKTEYNLSRYGFNFLFASGVELKIIESLACSLELLAYTPKYYAYNLQKTAHAPYEMGIRAGVSYLF